MAMPTANRIDKPAISMVVSVAVNLQKFEFPNMLMLLKDLKFIQAV